MRTKGTGSSITVSDWTDLARRLMCIEGRCVWSARGEARRYARIEPTLDRITQEWKEDLTGRLFVEQVLLRRFMDQAVMSLTPAEQLTHSPLLAQPATALILARHYAAPTRLLDWTDSLWIAAYFACSDCPDQAGFIRYFDRYQLTHNAGGQYGNETTELWSPTEKGYWLFNDDEIRRAHRWVVSYHLEGPRFPRMYNQQGLFTIASWPYADHWTLIRKMFRAGRKGCGFGLIKIEARAKPGVLQGLSRMGISAATLYPGLDGLGKSLSAFAGFSHLDTGIQECLRRPWRRR